MLNRFFPTRTQQFERESQESAKEHREENKKYTDIQKISLAKQIQEANNPGRMTYDLTRLKI